MQNSSHDEIVVDKGQSVAIHWTHWPSVNIKFEDIMYTVDNGGGSKCKLSQLNLFFFSFLIFLVFVRK